MLWLLSIAGGSIVLFVIHARICVVELRRGHRLYAAGARSATDAFSERAYSICAKKLTYLGRYIITLSWYYSLHAFLVVALRFIAGTYHAVERIVLRNRDRAKIIRREHKRSHLTDIAEHRTATELSPKQKALRKKHALDGTTPRR